MIPRHVFLIIHILHNLYVYIFLFIWETQREWGERNVVPMLNHKSQGKAKLKKSWLSPRMHVSRKQEFTMGSKYLKLTFCCDKYQTLPGVFEHLPDSTISEKHYIHVYIVYVLCRHTYEHTYIGIYNKICSEHSEFYEGFWRLY